MQTHIFAGRNDQTSTTNNVNSNASSGNENLKFSEANIDSAAIEPRTSMNQSQHKYTGLNNELEEKKFSQAATEVDVVEQFNRDNP